MLRIVKIALVVGVAAWGVLGALGNLIHWEGTTGAVAAVTSMSTFEPVAASVRATSNPVIIWAGALFIMLSKVVAGLLCFAGAWRMWQARASDAAAFSGAKTLALTGCGVAVFMLFTGFIVIAETWYELWRSEVMLGPVLGSAFRYAALIGVIALFVAARKE